MNILILNWRDPKNPKAGGAEIATIEHAKAWVQSGYSVDWFTSAFPGAKKEEVIDGVRIIRKGGSITTHLYAPFFYLTQKKQYDIVIDEIHGLPYLTPFYVIKKKKLAFIHEVADSVWDAMFPFPINKLGTLFERLSLLFYKSVPFITVSESTKNDLLSLEIKNITVIRNGVHIRKIEKKKESKPTFIFVSRLVKMKGVEDILKAFHIILQFESQARLWIVGEGEETYVQYLKKTGVLYGISKSITFFGKVSEEKKYDLLKRAHLLLHASVKEGWGLVVIEAASQKTPAVVYDVSGLRDSVKNGKTGLVVHPNTPEMLAKQTLTLLQDQDRYQRIQNEAYIWARSLTWKEATEKSLHLLESL